MFRIEATKSPTGNHQTKATCTRGHTVFKDQYHGNEPHRCAYCDADVY